LILWRFLSALRPFGENTRSGYLSLGAVWSACSPEFGVAGVLERLAQIAPRLLFATDGYRYQGQAIDTRERVRALELFRHLPEPDRKQGDFCQNPYQPACLFVRLRRCGKRCIVRLCAHRHALKTNENPAQSGMLFSGNRLSRSCPPAHVP
jgi:hypothetical protein